MRVYDWPRSGTPITDVPLGVTDLGGREFRRLQQRARRARTYMGGQAIVFRDPQLAPHIPRRAHPAPREG